MNYEIVAAAVALAAIAGAWGLYRDSMAHRRR